MALLFRATVKSTIFSSFLRRHPFAFSQLRPQLFLAMSSGSAPKQDGSSPEATAEGSPVKYSTSKAHKHSPFDTFLSPRGSTPRYQKYIIIASVTAFLVYFTMLREENDWDEQVERSLYDRVPGLKEKTIMAQIHQAREQGRDTAQLELQLKQLKMSSITAK